MKKHTREKNFSSGMGKVICKEDVMKIFVTVIVLWIVIDLTKCIKIRKEQRRNKDVH